MIENRHVVVFGMPAEICPLATLNALVAVRSHTPWHVLTSWCCSVNAGEESAIKAFDSGLSNSE